MTTSTIRSRWAAVGAAVAVSLGAGGIGITHATTSTGERPVFIPLDSPCRLASLRPAPNTVGPRPIGLGPGESYTLDGWGSEGDCTLPTGSTALALNVTAVNASSQTNLRFFPADAAVPDTANLNPSPGAPPTPNAVNVNLDATGKFKVFNKFGTVEVVIDVMGYYDDHNHDDRYAIEVVRPDPPVTFSPFYSVFTFVPDNVFTSINQPFTTTRAGRLQVSTTVSVSASCANSVTEYRIFFLMVDGEAIRSSAVIRQDSDKVRQHLSGVTDSVIPAGAHEITVGVECRVGSTSGSGTDFFSLSSVVVLPQS